MEHVRIPAHVEAARPGLETVVVGPPPGDGRDIEPAHMQRGSLGHVPYSFAHFRPSDEEIAALVAGGTIELALVGFSVQPFSLAVWAPPGFDEQTPPATRLRRV